VEIHYESFNDVSAYLEKNGSKTLEDKRPEYDRLLRYAAVDPDIELTNLETADIGEACYDVIICSSVFEHADFHQFRYVGLRRAFKRIGFSQIHDILDFADPQRFSGFKKKFIELSQRYWLFRKLFLLLFPTTTFVLVK
jgi:hypothetical protein